VTQQRQRCPWDPQLPITVFSAVYLQAIGETQQRWIDISDKALEVLCFQCADL
jgi:hypothetical protein